MAKDLTVSIVTYNSKACILDCLRSFYAHSDGLDMEIVVVDNNSRDDAAACIKASFPDTKVIANPDNVGFAAANNMVLANFDSRYCLISNPDIIVLPGALKAMVAFMDGHPDAGICGCKMLNPDLTLQYSSRRYPTPFIVLARGLLLDRLFPDHRLVRRYLMMDSPHDRVMPVDWLTGCCLMVRKEIVRDVGLLDERYFLYFEDVDFCYRVNRSWRTYYLPSVSMKHSYRHASRGFGNLRHKFHHMRSALRFFRKKSLFEKGMAHGSDAPEL